MILTTIKRTADLDRGVQKELLHAAFVMGDQEAHRFAVKLVRPSSKGSVSLSAAGVQGYFMRADGSTVVVDGEGEGDTAIVILPAACYAVPGRFTLIIRVSMGDTIHSVMIADGVVSRSRTDVLIDPGDAVPSLDALLAQIASLEAATKAAQEIVMRDEEAAGSASQHAANAAASAGAAMNAAAEAETSAQEAGSSEQSAKAAGNRAASSASNAETSALRAEAAANRAENAQIPDTVIAKAVNDYLAKNPIESVVVDTTLSKAGEAADAAAAGQKIRELSEEMDLYGTELDMHPKPSKNLNITPYDETHTEKGVIFTTNADNSVSISGTPTGNVYWPAVTTATEKRWQLPAGTYTLSGAPGPLTGITLLTYASQTSTTATGDYAQGGNDGAPVQVNIPNDCWAIIRIVVMNNWAGGHATIFPQLEAGEEATKYTSPWDSGFYSKRLTDIENAADDLNATVNALAVPEYYFTDDYLPSKIERINALARGVGADGDAFVFISDMHWEKNAGMSPALLKYLRDNTRIDRLFGGGDYMDNALTADPPLFDATEKLRDAWAGPRYLTLGNHDYMGSEAYALKDPDLYYAVNSYGTERIGNLNRNYYYVDNPQVKLRYIVLNRYIDRVPVNNEINGLNEEQRTWLQNVALDVEDGWGVLVFVHDLYRFVFDQGNDTASVLLNYTDSKAVVEILDAFRAAGGTVVGIFCGEAHNDRVNYTPGGIPVITTTCDKNKSGGEGAPISYQWEERADGTIHEQAFDVMIVDKAARTIHAVRIGYPARNSVEGAWGEKVEERTITY